MYLLYVVIVTYKSSFAGSGLNNTTAVFILMYAHVTLINIINQCFKFDTINRFCATWCLDHGTYITMVMKKNERTFV